MVMLACLAMGGLILGMFFNVYALAVSCVAVVVLNFASAFDVGLSKATLSFALAIIFYKLDISPVSWRRDYLSLKDCIDPYILSLKDCIDPYIVKDDAGKFLKVPVSNKERCERNAPPLASTIRRKDEFNKPRGVARRNKFAS
jgi:hypothetical protein